MLRENDTDQIDYILCTQVIHHTSDWRAHLRDFATICKDGSILVRQIVERRIGPEIARRSKHGFSIPLWRRSEVYRRMGFEDTIASSTIFQDFPFRPGARAFALDGRFRKLRWPFFVLARLHEQLRGGRTGRLDRSCPVTGRQRAGAF